MSQRPCAVIYVRVSDRKQLKGNGLGGQEQNCRNYAAFHGYEVINVFKEKGLSGGLYDRIAMNEMIDFIKRHKQETGSELIVIIDELKRWARQIDVHFALKLSIARAGGRLESPGFKFEDTSESRFVETVLAGAAELERNQNRDQVIRRMRARLELGFWPFVAPVGYLFVPHRQHKKVLKIDPVKGPVVALALERFSTGELQSVTDIIRFLERAGFYDGQAPHGKYHRSEGVEAMLRQVVYTGYVEYTPWKVTLRKGYHPQLIAYDVFEKIQARLKPATTLIRQDTREEFILRNLVACGHCGKPLTASWSAGRCKRYPYYHCYSRQCNNYGRTIPVARLDEDYGRLLQAIEVRDDILNRMKDALHGVWREEVSKARIELDLLPKRLAEVEKHIAALIEKLVLVSNPTAIAAIEDRIATLEREKVSMAEQRPLTTTAEEHVGTLIEQGLSFIKDPYHTWFHGSLETKRQVSSVVFTCAPPYIRNQGFGTPDLSLPWRISHSLCGQKSSMVDPSGNIWNQLIDWLLVHENLILSSN